MSSVADEGSGAAFGRLRTDRQTPFFLTWRQESAAANRQVGTTCKGSCVHVLAAWYTSFLCQVTSWQARQYLRSRELPTPPRRDRLAAGS